MIIRWMNRYRFALLVVFAYWLVLFVATHIPVSVPAGKKHFDKLLHFGAYFVLAFLLAWGCAKKWRLRPVGYGVIFLGVAVYGVLDELLQQLVPNRFADLVDWFADCGGALAALGFHFAMNWFWSHRVALAAEGNDR